MKSVDVRITPAVLIAGLGFFWKRFKELREYMAKSEGLFEGFTKRETYRMAKWIIVRPCYRAIKSPPVPWRPR